MIFRLGFGLCRPLDHHMSTSSQARSKIVAQISSLTLALQSRQYNLFSWVGQTTRKRRASQQIITQSVTPSRQRMVIAQQLKPRSVGRFIRTIFKQHWISANLIYILNSVYCNTAAQLLKSVTFIGSRNSVTKSNVNPLILVKLDEYHHMNHSKTSTLRMALVRPHPVFKSTCTVMGTKNLIDQSCYLSAYHN